MKTTKKLFAVTVLLVLVSCEPEQIKSNKLGDGVEFNSAVSIWHQPMHINSSKASYLITSELTAQGESKSPYLDGFKLVLLHDAVRNEFSNEVKFKNGILKITGVDGHQVFGEYAGYGDYTKELKEIVLRISVKGGTGYYKNASGFLNGVSYQDGTNPRLRILELNGKIILAKKSDS